MGKIILCIILMPLLMLLVSDNYLYAKGYHLYNATQASLSPELKVLCSSCGWVPVPKWQADSKETDKKETVWPSGQRASRINQETNAPYKVLVLGCSYTYGVGLADQDTFVWKLNQRFKNASFDNYAVPAYGTYQCLMLMDYLMARQKYNMVIYVTIADHPRRCTEYEVLKSKDNGCFGMLRPYVKLKEGKLDYYPSSRTKWPFEETFLTVNFLKHIYYIIQRPQYSKGNPPSKETIQEQNKAYLLLVNDMMEVAKKHSAKFVVAAIEEPTLPVKYSSRTTFVNLTFPLFTDPKYHLTNDVHPNEKSNIIWAAKLTSWLWGQGLR